MSMPMQGVRQIASQSTPQQISVAANAWSQERYSASTKERPRTCGGCIQTGTSLHSPLRAKKTWRTTFSACTTVCPRHSVPGSLSSGGGLPPTTVSQRSGVQPRTSPVKEVAGQDGICLLAIPQRTQKTNPESNSPIASMSGLQGTHRSLDKSRAPAPLFPPPAQPRHRALRPKPQRPKARALARGPLRGR